MKKCIFFILLTTPLLIKGQNISKLRTLDSSLVIVNQEVPEDTLWKFTKGGYLLRYESNIPVDTVSFLSDGGGAGSPGGSNYDIQYNDAGSFGGSDSFTWNDTTLKVSWGTRNVFIGTESGLIKTANGSTLLNNTFLGHQAGRGSGTEAAVGNTGVGYLAGGFLDNGDFNTFVGSSAGASTTDGFGNVFLGKDAGEENTTGGRNTVVGEGASEVNNGSFNTCIGNNAGSLMTAGDSNVFIGLNAGGTETGSSKLYLSNGGRDLIKGDFLLGTVTINDIMHIAPKASAPASPALGWIYVNSTDNHIYFYNGTGWVQMDN